MAKRGTNLKCHFNSQCFNYHQTGHTAAVCVEQSPREVFIKESDEGNQEFTGRILRRRLINQMSQMGWGYTTCMYISLKVRIHLLWCQWQLIMNSAYGSGYRGSCICNVREIKIKKSFYIQFPLRSLISSCRCTAQKLWNSSTSRQINRSGSLEVSQKT